MTWISAMYVSNRTSMDFVVFCCCIESQRVHSESLEFLLLDGLVGWETCTVVWWVLQRMSVALVTMLHTFCAEGGWEAVTMHRSSVWFLRILRYRLWMIVQFSPQCSVLQTMAVWKGSRSLIEDSSFRPLRLICELICHEITSHWVPRSRSLHLPMADNAIDFTATDS